MHLHLAFPEGEVCSIEQRRTVGGGALFMLHVVRRHGPLTSAGLPFTEVPALIPIEISDTVTDSLRSIPEGGLNGITPI